jgi:hypothetical protein
MRRPAAAVLALLTFAPAGAPAGHAATPSGPPHAWLFGAWTGGLYPAPSVVTAQSCLAQPTVIFTRDVVLRASLTEPSYGQRIVATAQTHAGATEFQFAPAVDPATATSSALLQVAAPKADGGFGCETADVLHVVRRGENEIIFPGCADFPEPLVRCPAR